MKRKSFWSAWRARALPMRLSHLRHCRASYSHYGEDVVARTYLHPIGQQGFYVDVGCFEPIRRSNTFAFYRAGWRGIAVDVNDRYASLWRRHRPRDRFIAAAIAEHEQEYAYEVNEVNPGANRLVEPATHQRRPGEPSDARFRTRRLDEILTSELGHSGTKIDLMSIDCEGLDLSVLRSNDFETFRPRVLIVEDMNSTGESAIHDYCSSQLGYRLKAVAHVSRIYVDSRAS